jgi:NADH:ubiquinone oxidoreductase subunit 2 (subunit N)
MKWMRLSARLIVVLWAGFWIFFAVGSAIDGGGKTDIHAGESLKGILAVAAIVLVCVGAIYLVWRRPLVAGISLILIGIVVTGAYVRISRPDFVLLIIGLPPFLSGILFLLSSTRRQRV